MAVIDEFRARNLLDAFRSIAAVLADHADAIDLLAASTDSSAGVTADALPGTDVGDPTDVSSADTGFLTEGSDDTGDALGVGADASATLARAVSAAGTPGDLVTLTSRMSSAAGAAAVGPGGRVVVCLLEALADISASADSIDAERLALALELTAELAAAETGDGHDPDPSPVAQETDRGPVGTAGTGGAASVIAAASVGALRAVDQGMELVEVLIAAADEGLDELESGVATNERLGPAGVVDAAGAVFLLVLDSLAAIVAGDPLPEPPSEAVDRERAPGTVFRISCVAVPLDAPGAGRGDARGDTWVDTCTWLESTLGELGVVERFRMVPTGCELEVRTRDAGRTIESVCSVARPSELSIRVDTGASMTDPTAAVRAGDDRSW